MIKSKFVSDILELLLAGDAEGLLASKQIPFLTEKDDVDYTGVGAFYGFNIDKGIEEFRLAPTGSTHLNGVEITSSELNTSAEAIAHFQNGIISSLEIWSHGGEYPSKELSSYKLRQLGWAGSSGKQIEVSSASA
jgi:hypothetical protein